MLSCIKFSLCSACFFKRIFKIEHGTCIKCLGHQSVFPLIPFIWGGEKSLLLLLYLLMEKATKEPNLLRSVTQMHSFKNGEAMK